MPVVGKPPKGIVQVLWCSWPVVVLFLAAIADFGIGDPQNWVHPVQIMGQAITAYKAFVFKIFQSSTSQRLAGIFLGLGLPLLCGVIAGLGVWMASLVSAFLGLLTAAILMASCFAERSLRDAAFDVLAPLSESNLPAARQHLSQYVGRDTANLEEPEILRAIMETISENATDGVLAPLFYALLGLAIHPMCGVPFAIAYKTISTLDSMVGYRTPPYTHLGWFSARCEDAATWLPCRLTVLTIALQSQRPGNVVRLCQRDAPADPSPNAGWSECAYAAALDVQLGGSNYYQGQLREKPLLGDPGHPIDGERIQQALTLTRRAFLVWLVLGSIGLGVRYGLNCGSALL